jgi:hypothetical protein
MCQVKLPSDAASSLTARGVPCPGCGGPLPRWVRCEWFYLPPGSRYGFPYLLCHSCTRRVVREHDQAVLDRVELHFSTVGGRA